MNENSKVVNYSNVCYANKDDLGYRFYFENRFADMYATEMQYTQLSDMSDEFIEVELKFGSKENETVFINKNKITLITDQKGIHILRRTEMVRGILDADFKKLVEAVIDSMSIYERTIGNTSETLYVNESLVAYKDLEKKLVRFVDSSKFYY